MGLHTKLYELNVIDKCNCEIIVPQNCEIIPQSLWSFWSGHFVSNVREQSSVFKTWFVEVKVSLHLNRRNTFLSRQQSIGNTSGQLLYQCQFSISNQISYEIMDVDGTSNQLLILSRSVLSKGAYLYFLLQEVVTNKDIIIQKSH